MNSHVSYITFNMYIALLISLCTHYEVAYNYFNNDIITAQ